MELNKAEIELKEILSEDFNLILTDQEIKDFQLDGDESYKTLKEYAKDYASDVQTERADAIWRKRMETDEFENYYREHF